MNLCNQGWKTYWFDMENPALIPKNCKFTKKELTEDNVLQTFKELNVPIEIDLLSIDIDGNDYYIRNALSSYNPMVYIIEYNGRFASDDDYIMPRNDAYRWNGQRDFGASLLSLTKQANRLGYELVYCDSKGVNAFFVRKDINVFFNLTSEQAYVLPNVQWISQEEILRRQEIDKLYKNILKRTADEGGVNHYHHSNLSIAEIRNILLNSEEFKNKKKNMIYTNIPALFVRTSKTGTSFVNTHLHPLGVSSTFNAEFLDSEVNLEIISKQSNAFKFTITKNPYDRAYSCWRSLTQTPSTIVQTNFANNYLLPPDLSFIDFLESDFYKDFNTNLHTLTHIIPVSEYLGDYIEQVDFVMKIENIKHDMIHLSNKIGFNIPHNFDWRPIYETPYDPLEKQKFLSDPKIIKAINEKYHNDFEIFGYNMK